MLPDKTDLILRDIKKEIYKNMYELNEWKIQEIKKKDKNKYEVIKEEKTFLTGNSSFWDNTGKIFFFHYKIQLPEILNTNNLYLHIDIDGECTLYINDEIYRGLNEKDIRLPKTPDNFYHFKILATYDVHLYAQHQRIFDHPYPPHLFRKAFLFKKNKTVENLYFLLLNTKKTIEILNSKDKKIKLKDLLNSTLNYIDFYTTQEQEFINSINTAYKHLKNNLQMVDRKNHGKVHLLGHSHLDLAFKWRITDTIRKLERTISTTLNLMDSFDNYYFIQTQAILYDYLKKYFPELFEKTLKKYKENKFLVEGAFWVEADINLPNGESLIRQILYGKKFYKNNFNKKSNICWLPDCFGFSAILPQILKKSNIDYFVTTKLHWNDTNIFPYNIFKWEGIDGSKIFSYLLPDTYGGNLEPKKIKEAWDNRKQKNLTEVLSLYGFGDGGGGNSEVQLNNYKALNNLAYLPDIKTGDISNHFSQLFSRNKLPIWKDELYLEKHRGTYTTQAKLKKYNRCLEFTLRNTELLNSLAKIDNYEKKYDFEKLWKILLKNQFHDILPGSCIRDVYKDAVQDYQELESILKNIENEIFEHFTEKISLNSNEVLLFNPNSFTWNSLISIKKNNFEEEYTSIKINNKVFPLQVGLDKFYFKFPNLKQLDFSKIQLLKNKTVKYENNLKSHKYQLENNLLKVKFSNEGEIVSIIDKEKQIEYIEKNKTANKLKLYDDKSTYFDAWDISISEGDKKIINNLEEIKVNKKGQYFHSIVIKRNFYRSFIKQEIRLYENKRKIDFITEIDWQESQKLLKTFFPINLKNGTALFDLSMGYIKRENYKNTSWEKAKTEVPAHKWININNKDKSVSLLNDCKYGHEIKENTMALTLLKSGIYPDPKADIGEHNFTYSLLLNPGGLNLENIEKEAMMLNNNLLKFYGTKPKNTTNLIHYTPFLEIENDNIFLDCFKAAVNKKGYLLRVHENSGKNGKLSIYFNRNIKKLYETNLLENNINELEINNNRLTININGFEIKSFRIII
ncbi:MAG: glycoside hydrolase family 38 C-terminal domain-containing protein [Halanaerobiales bacterium]